MGEHSYTQVLADDLTGNGYLDLLLSTMNGNLYCFETDTSYAPLRTWRSANQGRNVHHLRDGYHGVSIDGALGRHAPRHVSGSTFLLDFTIVDYRWPLAAPGGDVNVLKRAAELQQAAALSAAKKAGLAGGGGGRAFCGQSDCSLVPAGSFCWPAARPVSSEVSSEPASLARYEKSTEGSSDFL